MQTLWFIPTARVALVLQSPHRPSTNEHHASVVWPGRLRVVWPGWLPSNSAHSGRPRLVRVLVQHRFLSLLNVGGWKIGTEGVELVRFPLEDLCD